MMLTLESSSKQKTRLEAAGPLAEDLDQVPSFEPDTGE